MTHPDEVVKLICALAKEHGYGVVSLEMIGTESGLPALPKHSYEFDYVESVGMDEKRTAAQV